MGRVFSLEQIEQGQIPTPADFERAKDVFLEVTEYCITDGYLDGGFIFGSVANGTANRRSDMDACLVLQSGNSTEFAVAREISACIEEETGGRVPFHPIVNSKLALERGLHDIDRYFGQHLKGDGRLVRGNDPADFMTFPWQTTDKILEGYLLQKKRKLTNTYLSWDNSTYERGIQRMLELPAAVGRKTLQALNEVGEIDGHVENSADKPAVLAASRTVLNGLGLGFEFEQLISLDQDYSEALSEAIDGTLDRDYYRDMLDGLNDFLPSTITWLERMVDKLALLIRLAPKY